MRSILNLRRTRLRRIAPERARLAPRHERRRLVPRAAEKVMVAVAAGATVALLVGAGRAHGFAAWLSLAALVALGFAFFAKYLSDFRRTELGGLSRVVALAAFLLAPVALLRTMEAVGWGEVAILPLSFLGLVLALVWHRAFALECVVFASALVGLFAAMRPLENGVLSPLHGFVVVAAGGLAACLAAERLRRRVVVVQVGLFVGLVEVAVATALLELRDAAFGPDEVRLLVHLGAKGLAVGLVATGALRLIESIFGVTTDVTLLELGNTHEQPLLRKLLLEAPGTFHHSYIVGLLSEAGAEAVGANSLLARVGALYHDVGKLNKPTYFAENSPEARRRHQELSPEMSTLIISAHTRDGLELGAYHGLPPSILAFIPEHHGTSCIEYFFHAARKLRGSEAVREEDFRYPGPRPQRIETAIVMIADAVEAISRQMAEPTHARLQEMVHEVVIKRLMDRQFDECAVTLRELELVEKAFVRVLSGIYHTRPTFRKGRAHPLDLSQPAEARRAAER